MLLKALCYFPFNKNSWDIFLLTWLEYLRICGKGFVSDYRTFLTIYSYLQLFFYFIFRCKGTCVLTIVFGYHAGAFSFLGLFRFFFFSLGVLSCSFSNFTMGIFVSLSFVLDWFLRVEFLLIFSWLVWVSWLP